MARQRTERAIVDLGTPERWQHGDVELVGDGRAHGRVRGLVDTLPVELRGAATMVLNWFDRARFNGYARSNFDGVRSSAAASVPEISDSAIAARERLADLQARLGRLQWLTIWHLLVFEESQSAWAARARNSGYAVTRNDARAVLVAALDAVAAMHRTRG